MRSHPKLYRLPLSRMVAVLSALPNIRTAWRLPNGTFSADERDLNRLDYHTALRFRLFYDGLGLYRYNIVLLEGVVAGNEQQSALNITTQHRGLAYTAPFVAGLVLLGLLTLLTGPTLLVVPAMAVCAGVAVVLSGWTQLQARHTRLLLASRLQEAVMHQ